MSDGPIYAWFALLGIMFIACLVALVLLAGQTGGSCT